MDLVIFCGGVFIYFILFYCGATLAKSWFLQAKVLSLFSNKN
jgi:hypothetical protein